MPYIKKQELQVRNEGIDARWKQVLAENELVNNELQALLSTAKIGATKKVTATLSDGAGLQASTDSDKLRQKVDLGDISTSSDTDDVLQAAKKAVSSFVPQTTSAKQPESLNLQQITAELVAKNALAAAGPTPPPSPGAGTKPALVRERDQ